MAPMRRFLLLFVLLLTACQVMGPLPAGTPEPSPTPSASFSVIYHPDGPLYVGDQVSLEVLSPANFDVKDKSIRIALGTKTLGEANFQHFGIGGREEATFYWTWDTKGLSDGSYTLTFSVLPGGLVWQEQVSLLPAAGVPSPEPNARWEAAETNCCIIHYISSTDVARDIEKLKTMADAQFADVQRRLGTNFTDKVPVTFLPRTLGQGGFEANEVYVSYLDQNYAGGTASQVLHHEMVHWVDAKMGGDWRPTILVEGLAVFMSDGHFKVEPILPRAAALLDLGWYIPLRDLTNTFYFAQHEISYVEGAALVGYLIQTYDWERFNAFYRDIHPSKSGQQADALDAALQAHFHQTLAQVEKNFLAFLRQQSVDEAIRTDLRLSVSLYDLVRRYQRSFDPSAYFMNAWLVDVPTMRERGIVADYLRHPHAAFNQRLESLLVSADAHLRVAEYSATETDLRAVSLLLDVLGK
jgi:hypothetical protein